MKTILSGLVVLLVIGAIAYGMGWITFGKTDEGNPEIIIHQEKFKDDTEKGVEKVKHVFDKNAPATPEPSFPGN